MSQEANGYFSSISDELIPKPEFHRVLKWHSDTVSMIAFNSNNKQMVSSSFDHNVLVWDLFNLGKKPLVGQGHKSLVNDISIAPSGFFYATASSDHTVRIWSNTYDYSSKDMIQSQVLKFNSAPVKSVDFSCDSKIICTGSDDKSVKVISIADKKLQANLLGHTNWVKNVRFSRDSNLIASGSDDKTLRLWDVIKKSQCYSFEKDHRGAVNCVRFHPDNSCLATACFDTKIRLFDIRSKQLVQTYNDHQQPATSVAFHPSGNFLASTAYDETIKLFDLRMGETLFTLKAHSGAVTSIAFSPFGNYFAAGGLDSQISFWESNLEHYMDNTINYCGESGTIQSQNQPTSKRNDNQSKINYKNQTAQEQKLNSLSDNLSESLTNVFDKMVSQMEMITNSFVNFESRLTGLEETLEDLN